MALDSIANIGKWERVDEVVALQQSQEELVPVGMREEKSVKPANTKVWQIPVQRVDSATKAREDSVTRSINDSLAKIRSGYGIILEDPYYIKDQKGITSLKNGGNSADGISWIFATLGILFCLICFKSRNNSKYFRQLLHVLQDTRIRHNMFDNTVRETSFMIILNILWMVCAGILLWEGVDLYYIRQLGGAPPIAEFTGILCCIGVTAAYVIVMLLLYWITGSVFSDPRTTKEWIKGANAATALEGVALLPPALIALCYPESSLILVEIGAVLIIIGKILFIYKGFRIFFSQIASLLVFLYYFCSLEIIPLILVFFGAVKLVGIL